MNLLEPGFADRPPGRTVARTPIGQRHRLRSGPGPPPSSQSTIGSGEQVRIVPGWADTYRRHCLNASGRGKEPEWRCSPSYRSLFLIAYRPVPSSGPIELINQYGGSRLLGRTSPREVKGPGWVFVVPSSSAAFEVDLPTVHRVPVRPTSPGQRAVGIDFLITGGCRWYKRRRGGSTALEHRPPLRRDRRHPARRRVSQARANRRGPASKLDEVTGSGAAR